MDPWHQVEAGYDRIAEQYLSAKNVHDPGLLAALEELARGLPVGGKALDLGCGAGVPVTQWLAQRFEVTGVDISGLFRHFGDRGLIIGICHAEGARNWTVSICHPPLPYLPVHFLRRPDQHHQNAERTLCTSLHPSCAPTGSTSHPCSTCMTATRTPSTTSPSPVPMRSRSTNFHPL